MISIKFPDFGDLGDFGKFGIPKKATPATTPAKVVLAKVNSKNDLQSLINATLAALPQNITNGDLALVGTFNDTTGSLVKKFANETEQSALFVDITNGTVSSGNHSPICYIAIW